MTKAFDIVGFPKLGRIFWFPLKPSLQGGSVWMDRIRFAPVGMDGFIRLRFIASWYSIWPIGGLFCVVWLLTCQELVHCGWAVCALCTVLCGQAM